MKAAMLRAFQWDLARQVERLDWLLAQLPRYADWGYNELYLHLEDAVEYPSLPGVARPDAYAYREMEKLVATATRAGIKVVPIVNLLGHTQYLLKVPQLRELNELREADGSPRARGQICPLHPRTPEIAEKLLRDMAPFCTAGKVHVGLDESFHLGQHPLSRQEIARIGRAAHFAGYVGRLRELTRSLGLAMGMWADMLYFLPDAIPLLPRDIAAYEWYYYPFSRRPRVELFNFAETKVGERLRARGIEYWGCPMNGAFRYEPLPHFSDRLDNILSWWRRCQRLGASGLLVTSWEPYRLAIELTAVVDAAAASLWLDGDTTDPRVMLERGFRRVFGRRHAKASAAIALACDRHPFSGYPRWEINSRWDVVSRREHIDEYRREERHFRRLVRRVTAAGARFPEPLRASVSLRWYLAARDRWIRETQRAALNAADSAQIVRAQASSFRTIVRVGLRAARTMWARTRDRKVRGPNEEILHADLARLHAGIKGEPVFGPVWQLCYRVRNVAPAVQQVMVQQQQSDRTWKILQACHTIEFQSRAARRRGGLVREHAAPIEWNGPPNAFPALQLVLRGTGQVKIEDVELTDGFTRWRWGRRKIILGRPAPRRGWIAIENQKDAMIRLRFSQSGRSRRQPFGSQR